MTRKHFLLRAGAFAVAPSAFRPGVQPRRPDWVPSPGGNPAIFSPMQFGARGDGATLDTQAIQAAIDAAGKLGGMVYLEPGRYLSGTLELKGSVTLYLASGATLIASPRDNDFEPMEKLSYETYTDAETSDFHHALIRGENLEGVAILGQGIIDLNRDKRGGPKPIALRQCRHISIQDITLKNAPNYSVNLLGCDYVNIDGITILNGFADGIDPDCCQNVRIANCYIECWDDAICPKASLSLGHVRSTENITVMNCLLRTACAGFKLGTDSCGGFKNILFSNSAVFGHRDKWGRGPLSAIDVFSVDGGHIERVSISNITLDDAYAAFFIRLGNRGHGQKFPEPGTIQHVSIANLTATRTAMTSAVVGIPGHFPRDISLTDISICATGKGTAEQALQAVSEHIAEYPDVDMFGILPAYGLYCRHVEDLMLAGCQFSLEQADERPAMMAEDVIGLDILSLRAAPPSRNQPVISFRDVSRAFLQGSRALPGTRNFLSLSGQRTQKIHVVGNDLSEVSLPFSMANEVQKDAILEEGNLLVAGAP